MLLLSEPEPDPILLASWEVRHGHGMWALREKDAVTMAKLNPALLPCFDLLTDWSADVQSHLTSCGEDGRALASTGLVGLLAGQPP